MNDFFQENKRLLLLVTSLLVIFSIVLYFLLSRPLSTDLAQEEQTVLSTKDEIAALQTQVDELNDDSTDVDIEELRLEKKVPAQRELPEYILSIEELEQYTKSRIEQIEFTYDSGIDDLNEFEEDVVENEDNDEANEEPEDNDEITNEDDETVADDELDDEETVDDEVTPDPEVIEELPEDLEMMTVRVTAQIQTFDAIVSLVRAVENQDRISIVSRIHFTMPTEEDELFSEDMEYPAVEMDLTTFYYTN